MAEFQYTPITLWQDFDAADVETEVNVVRSRRSGVLLVKSLFFSGSNKGLAIFANPSDRPEKSRIYAEYCRPAKKAADNAMAAVIIVNEPGKGINGALMRKLSRESGCAVLSLDLDGGDEPLSSTRYAPDVSYANYSAAAKAGFGFKDARNSCIYEWAAVTMRAVTVLSAFPEIDPDKIGLFSIGKACDIGAAAAYRDARINRLCILFGEPNAFSYADERMQKQYTAALSVKAYAQHIKCPVLYMGATNESAYDIFEACEVFSRVQAPGGSLLSLSTGLDHEISFDNKENLRLWFSGMQEGLPPPTRPALEFNISENKLYGALEMSDPAVSARLVISYGAAQGKTRHWVYLPMQQTGKNEYIASVKPFTGQAIFAYAEVVCAAGMRLSTRVAVKNPPFTGMPEHAPERRRLIYNAEAGTGGFTTISGNVTFHRLLNVEMKTGPLGLSGISNNVGYLATYKIGSELHRGGDGESLLIDIAAGKSTELEIIIRDREGEEYIYRKHITAGRWQKVAAEAKMFKTAGNRPLAAFDRAALLYFKPSQGHILVSSMLWT